MDKISREYCMISFVCVVFFVVFPAGFCFAQYEPLLPDGILNSKSRGAIEELLNGLVLIQELTKPATLEELVNPSFFSDEERKKRLAECERIERALNRLIQQLAAAQKYSSAPEFSASLLLAIQLKKLVLTYVVFASEWDDEIASYISPGNERESVIMLKIPKQIIKDKEYIIDNVRESYEAMLEKWKKLGLDIPKGYIYVKVFPSQKDIDAFLGQEDQGKKAGGVTFPCRFIALPWTNSGVFKSTLDHEIVHVLVNATGGHIREYDVPLWWREGLATFLSDDLGVQLVEYNLQRDGNGNFVSSSLESHTDKDYMKYKSYFEYVEAVYGKSKLVSFINSSTKKSVPETLKSIFGISSEQQFFLQASEWKKKQSHRDDLLLVAVMIGLLLSLFTALMTNGLFIVIWLVLCAVSGYVAIYYQYSVDYRNGLIAIISAVVIVNIVALFVRNEQRGD